MTAPQGTPHKPQQDRLLEHDADGIREYDNPMPRWWVWGFWITIVWAVVYFVNIIPGVGTGAGREANYAAEMAAADAKYGAARAAAASRAVEVTPEALWALASDPARLEAGGKVFASTCMPCHLADGGGSIGPNLTDDHWIHGGQPMDIHRVIDQGVLDKGMPAWREVLSPDDVLAVTAHVLRLHGTRPETAKEPQGVRVAYEDGRPVASEPVEAGSQDAEGPRER